VLHDAVHVDFAKYDLLKKWFAAQGVSAELAATALNVAFGRQDGDAAARDPVTGDWPSIRTLIARANGSPAYLEMLRKLNANQIEVTPSHPSACKVR
jgi:hypothetical protein